MMFRTLSQAAINLMPKRYIRKPRVMKSWPNDWVPFHWSRPEPAPGYEDQTDLVDLGQPNASDLLPEVRLSLQLNKLDLDDPVRKIFAIDHAKRSRWNKFQTESHTNKLGLIHKFDYVNSLEAKIISDTFSLRQVLERVKIQTNTRYNANIKTMANSIKYRRYHNLCLLKELHGDRYERLAKALNLDPPDNAINVPFVRPYRKTQMRKLVIEYAQKMKEKKVEEFIQCIEQEKKIFDKEKAETMQWIEQKEKELLL